MATKPNFIQGHLGQQRSIGIGQNWVTFNSIYNITTRTKKQGKPVESHFSEKDATPIWPLTGAIFKAAPHPNAAKLFLAWLLEPAQQVATEHLVGAARTCRRRRATSRSFVSGGQRLQGFMTNEAQIVALRKRFEGYTGPVVNAGGVR